MIRVVGANPAMDRVATWPGLLVGGVNRATEVTTMAGGKSLNLARAVRALGVDVAAYGFLGGRVGEALRDTVSDHGIVDRHTRIEGETRICFVVVDAQSGQTTMLNEPGPRVTPEETAHLLADLRSDCSANDIVILSGSLPDSVDPVVAGEIVAIGNEAGGRTISDTHSQALREVVRREPWMLKCNQDELAGLIGVNISDRAALERYRARSLAALAGDMQRVRGGGTEVVVVTLGEKGALLADESGCVHVRVPPVHVINSTGCGDVFLAGLVVGLERGERPRDAIVLGAACGTMAATRLPAELPADFDPDAWMPRISLEVVPVAP